MKNFIKKVIAGFVTFTFAVSLGVVIQPVFAATKQTFYKVTKVIDGDTIQVKIGSKKEKVRLIGIDTPETVSTSKPVACFGKEASEKAKEMLLGKKVRLEADATNSDRDKYNRLLRYVYLKDGTFVNQYLLKEGYAYAYLKFPFQYKEKFKQDQKAASDATKGLWGVCKKKTEPQPAINQIPAVDSTPQPTCTEDRWKCSNWTVCLTGTQSRTCTLEFDCPSALTLKPAETQTCISATTSVIPSAQPSSNAGCTIKGNISSDGEKIYHVLGGAYYSRTDIDESKGERWFCSEAEAVAAGWRKSQR